MALTFMIVIFSQNMMVKTVAILGKRSDRFKIRFGMEKSLCQIE